MAVHPTYTNTTAAIAAPESDYGSDIDDAIADELFSQAESQVALKETVVKSRIAEEQPIIAELEEDVYTHNHSVRLARLRQSHSTVLESGIPELEAVEAPRRQRRSRDANVEVEYDERNRGAFSPSNAEEETVTSEPPSRSRKYKKDDTRSPLQRFKSRRPLSVTNLVSPSWCEQQYEYNLSNYGRIPKTKAMSAGSVVHKELEEQVHVEVPVEVVSREDRHGLKMWNTIQGLRALRETGLTRELEVWGVLGGEVVNGIIDEISVECPDAAMEERVLAQMSGDGGGKGKKEPQLAPGQKTLTDFLSGSQGGSILENHPSFLGTLRSDNSEPSKTTYYLKDIKTTRRSCPPAHPAYTRGAHLQLMIYHRMLSSLAANEVSAEQVFARYHLDPTATFSDKFIAELANLDMRAFVSVPEQMEDLPPSQRQQDPLTELLEYNTLTLLWTLLVKELQYTFPSSAASTPTSSSTISPLLTVEYRNPSSTSSTDALIGTHTFALRSDEIDAYLRTELLWWRGQRPTEGVSLEDAWKCGPCEFAEGCTWRKEKVEEGLERVRLRKQGLGVRSGV